MPTFFASVLAFWFALSDWGFDLWLHSGFAVWVLFKCFVDLLSFIQIN
jgi:hypothetical protein